MPRVVRASQRQDCSPGSSAAARAGLAALACVALVSFAAPAQAQAQAQAQTQATLVSNYASRHATETLTVGDSSATDILVQAQRFETGPRPVGYPLTSVKFRVANLDDENVSPLACNYQNNAIVNTGTPTSESGVSVYWLNGEKVADNYADLYDGSWDSNQPRNSLGEAAPGSGDGGRVAHGCQSSGRGHEDHYIGAVRIETGLPGIS